MKAFAAIHPGGFQIKTLRGPFQPVGYQPSRQRVGQIQINPHVEAPISIELGSLPLSFGLFLGSGASFLVGSQVPSIREVTTIAGVALAGLGVVNLLLPKKASEAAPPSSAPVTPGTTSGPLPQTDEQAFALVEGQILSPGDNETIDVSAFGQPKIPMRLRLTNPSTAVANFDLMLDVNENPHPIGNEITAQQTMRISLPPGETRDFDVTIPIASWDALVDYVEVDVVARKRRFAGGAPAMMDSVLFVLE